MDLAQAITQHGYWVLALGALAEGETVVTLAGFAAHRGYLSLAAVLAIASAGGWAGDQAMFWLGRRHGAAVLRRWPTIARQTQRVHRLVERYPHLSIVGVRFAYGLRLAGPVLIGGSTISAGRFAVFNAFGAVLWATLFVGVGWFFGQAAEVVLGRIGRLEGWLLLGLIALGALLWVVRRLLHARRP